MKSRCNQQIKSKNRVKDFGEVYTQEREVKAMLDLVKEESYKTNSLFLEPACGNGNFLIEILKRKLSACETREDVLISLSSIYAIDILEDNILESKERLFELVKYALTREEAFFIMNKNIVCGNSLELLNKQKYLDMKFDVIIGNPPYQLRNGKGSDIPLYHKFVNTAKKLNPKYISMIIPSRWLIGGKKELKTFRTQMLSDRKISFLYDFKNSRDCFSGVDIEGGVCYFLWDSKFEGKATVITNENGKIESSIRELLEDKMDTFIRDNLSINICKKVQANRENTFDSIVSSQTPFGLITSFNEFKREYFVNSLKLHKRNECVFVDEKYLTKNRDLINKHKVLISKSYGMGKTSPYQVLNHPFYSEPGECCTQTYLVISSFSDKIEAQNAISYMKTKFFRFMVYLKKISQDNGPSTFSLVPIQDFTKPWTDEELYRKYNLTDEEINYIESMIRPMI